MTKNETIEDMETLQINTPAVWKRMASWTYEGILLFGVVYLTDYVFSAITQTRHALDNRHAQQLVIFAVLGAYFVWQWTRSGQTLPMKTWHIRLVDARTGKLPSLGRAFWRYVLCWLWLLPPLALAQTIGLGTLTSLSTLLVWVAAWAGQSHMNRNKQFLHDIWAGTALQTHFLPTPTKRKSRP